mmetsp:Transcript_17455/g.36239  ORF Transcript_17455/g.36239 Transcript_17455/m.36239 type:complete len:154 (+) Transcript_17455:2652-3113(+)
MHKTSALIEPQWKTILGSDPTEPSDRHDSVSPVVVVRPKYENGRDPAQSHDEHAHPFGYVAGLLGVGPDYVIDGHGESYRDGHQSDLREGGRLHAEYLQAWPFRVEWGKHECNEGPRAHEHESGRRAFGTEIRLLQYRSLAVAGWGRLGFGLG